MEKDKSESVTLVAIANQDFLRYNVALTKCLSGYYLVISANTSGIKKVSDFIETITQ